MQAESLKNIVRDIQRMKSETQNIELKAAAKGCPTRLFDTLSSFSNQDEGGIILFGIDEERGYAVNGVYDPQDLQKKVTEQCKQMQPPVRALFTACEIDGVTIVSVEIPGVDIADRPVFYKGVGRIKGSYVRVGESDEPMNEYEVYSYDAFRKRVRDDIRVVENTKFSLVDEIRMAQYLHAVRNEQKNLAENVSIRIEMYRDRMEILSSGGLYGKITIDALGKVRPETRNAALANILELLHITENRYSGIPTIRNECTKAGLPAPVFSVLHGEFRVVMKNGFFSEGMHAGESLLEFCEIPRTRAEIVAFVGKSKNYVMSQIVTPLVQSGQLKMTLPDKPKSPSQKFVKNTSCLF